MFLLFDIGGTNMRIAVSTDGQTISNSKIVPTPKEFDQGILDFKQVADELSKGEKIEGIAGGVAGPIDKEKTCLVKSPNIPGWINKPLKTELEKAFNCKVILENDTTVGGIGEAVAGAGKGSKIVAYIALGSGVGGKRVVDGKVPEDSFNFEPGHQIIVPFGDLCKCGGKGHMEPYVSGAYFEKKLGQKGENIIDQKIWDEITRYLAIGLVNATVFWTPDIIVLGGSVSKSIPLEKVNSYLKEFLTIYPTAPQVVLGALGHDAGFYGALELLK
ncbi:MAG: ROK family protein [Candidatus Daviesbacteria bacterium]|nr:ROK family protein [Candidatus Daviesbacteria bacterium]